MTLRSTAGHPGEAFEPTGDPMKDGVGAASYAHNRADRCDLTLAGEPKIQPMSLLPDFHVDHNDPDPRDMRVISGDGEDMGPCVDIWVDRSEPAIRYLEMELAGGTRKLIPWGYVRVRKGRMELHIQSLFAHNFADIPEPKAKDRITLLEEDKLFGYYAGGYRYAEPSRLEPLI
jgi:photosynthetic reaction center H subunit